MTARGPVVVTGATGFLGRHVCAELRAAGIPVHALVRPGARAPEGTRAFPWSGLEDAAAMDRAMDGADGVIHLAARVHVMRDHEADPAAAYHASNVLGTRALLQAARRAGIARFVLASTVKVMGEASATPWRETDTPAPCDPYGESKLECERMVLEGADAGVALRLPLVYGAGMKANMLRLFRAVDRGVPLPFGAIRNRRSLVYAGNAAAAFAHLLRSDAARGHAFFVSDGHDLSTPELVRAIAGALGRSPRLFPVPAGLFRAAGWAGDRLFRGRGPVGSAAVDRLLGSLAVDPEKLHRMTGFVPPHTVAEGLLASAAWYRTVSHHPPGS